MKTALLGLLRSARCLVSWKRLGAKSPVDDVSLSPRNPNDSVARQSDRPAMGIIAGNSRATRKERVNHRCPLPATTQINYRRASNFAARRASFVRRLFLLARRGERTSRKLLLVIEFPSTRLFPSPTVAPLRHGSFSRSIEFLAFVSLDFVSIRALPYRDVISPFPIGMVIENLY